MKIARRAGIALLVVAVLIVLGLAALHTPPARRFVLAKIQSILRSNGVDLQASSLSYDLLTASVTFQDIHVAARERDLPPILEADRLYVHVATLPLFRGIIRISSGFLERPVLRLVFDSKDRNNLPAGGGGEGQGKTASQTNSRGASFLQVGHFEIRDAALALRYEPDQAEVRLPLWRATIGDSGTSTTRIELETQQSGEAVLNGRLIPLDQLLIRAGANLGAEKVTLDTARIESAGSEISVNGTAANFSSPNISARAEARLSLERLADVIAAGKPASGEIDAQVDVEGPIAALRARFEITRVGPEPLKFGDLSADAFSAEGLYDARTGEVGMESLQLQMAGGSVEAQGKLALERGESSVRARMSNMDLERLAQALGLEFVLASRATGTVSVSWKDMDFRKADGRALIRFSRTRQQPREGHLPLAGEVEALISKGRVTLFLGQRPVNAGERPVKPELQPTPIGANQVGERPGSLARTSFRNAAYHPGGRNGQILLPVSASVTPFSAVTHWVQRFAAGTAFPAQGIGSSRPQPMSMDAIEALASLLTGQISIAPNGALSGRLSARILDLGELLSSLNALTGGSVPAKALLKGEADVVANLSGDTESPVIDVRTTSSSIQIGPLQDVSADIAAVYSPARLTIRSAMIRQQNQVVEAHGMLALAGDGPMDLEARATDLRLATVLDSMGRGDLPLSGTLSMQANVEGTLRKPRGTVTATANGLEAYGEPWGDLDIDAALADQRIDLTRLQLRKTIGEDAKAAGTANAKGSYDLATRQYVLELDTSDLRLHQLALSGRAVSGVLNAAVHGEGSVDHPTVSAQLNFSDLLFDTQDPAKQLSGAFKTEIKASGNSSNLRDLNVEFRADELNLSGSDFDLHATAPMRVTYQDRVLDVASAALVLNDGNVSIEGRLPLEPGRGEGDMRLNATLDLRSAYRLSPFLEKSDAMGMVNANVQVRGSLLQPAPEGMIELHDASFSYPALRSPLERVQVTVRLGESAVSLENARAAWAGAAIHITGAAPIALLAPSLAKTQPPADAAAQLNADVSGIQLAQIANRSSRGREDIGGVVSMHLEARARTLDLGGITANLRFDELNANVGGIQIDQQGNSSISLADGALRIDQFQLAGPETMIGASGTAELTGARNLNARLMADTNASLASIFVEGAQITGQTQIELTARGTLSDPDMQGSLSVESGQFAIDTPNVAATNVNLHMNFNGNRFDIHDSSGNLNGGDLKIAGGGSWQSGMLRDTGVKLSANDVYLNFPEGLLTVSGFDVDLESRGEFLVVGGSASVQDGTFRRNINVQTGIINVLQRGGSGSVLTSERSAFLSRVRYDLGLQTPTGPIVVDNNLGKFGVLSNVRLTGSYYQPSIVGRIQLDEAGELYLNGNTFYIERGAATFVSEQQIQPELDVLAHTKAAGYDITMSVTGPAGNITTTLTSDPPLTESDIVSVLLVGRPLKDVRGAEAEIASQQLLSYVAGGLGSALSSQLQQAFGFSQVRVEPVLVAGETTPDARLTIGQNLTSDLSLTYSRSLIDGGNEIWIGEYDALRSLVARITKQSDNSYRFDLNNDWQFGGERLLMSSMMRETKKVASVQFTGMPLLTEEQLAGKLKVKPGDDFDFFKLRKGTNRIQETLQDRARLEAQVRLGTTTQELNTDVKVDVQAGPVVDFAFEGWNPSRGLRGRIRELWREGIFDLQRTRQSTDAIREQLTRDGFLQAKVSNRIEMPGPDQKRVVFDIEPGRHFENTGLFFPGTSAIPPKELSEALYEAGLRDRVLIEPSKSRSLIERYYADRGYLGATVDLPRVQINGNVGAIAIPVEEGPLYHFQSAIAEGNQAYSDEEIAAASEIANGTAYAPETLDAAVTRVQKLYTDHGYNDAIVNYTLQDDDAAASVQPIFRVSEGKQHVVRQIVVDGNRETSEGMILSQTRVRTGDVLASPEISRIRSNLYQTSAYQLVELIHQVPDDPSAAAVVGPNQAPVDLTITVHEIHPYRILAGGYYDTDRGPGAIIDVSNRNSLGSARVLGLRIRYDADLQEARLYFSQPLLRRFPVRSLGDSYITREVKEAFVSNRLGASFGQEARLGNRYILNYSYRIERVRVFNRTAFPLASTSQSTEGGTPDRNDILADTHPIPPFGSLTRRLAPLTTTITRDTRDDILNATRGQFVSHGFAIGFNFLGSQQQYLKYFGQYFRFIPLSRPKPVPFRPNVKKPRFSYAGGVRFGIGRGLAGQSLIQSERFFAGGGTTIRGFKQDQVGPQNQNDVPLGGNAMFILNNEVRFPIWSFIGGVAFIDAGNVYPRIRDFNPLEIRPAAGIGLRLNTPWVLIRGDYGMKLNRHTGESAGAFFVSIGQAF